MHLADYAAAATNAGDYANYVAKLTSALVKDGLLTAKQKRIIMNTAGKLGSASSHRRYSSNEQSHGRQSIAALCFMHSFHRVKAAAVARAYAILRMLEQLLLL